MDFTSDQHMEGVPSNEQPKTICQRAPDSVCAFISNPIERTRFANHDFSHGIPESEASPEYIRAIGNFISKKMPNGASSVESQLKTNLELAAADFIFECHEFSNTAKLKALRRAEFHFRTKAGPLAAKTLRGGKAIQHRNDISTTLKEITAEEDSFTDTLGHHYNIYQWYKRVLLDRWSCIFNRYRDEFQHLSPRCELSNVRSALSHQVENAVCCVFRDLGYGQFNFPNWEQWMTKVADAHALVAATRPPALTKKMKLHDAKITMPGQNRVTKPGQETATKSCKATATKLDKTTATKSDKANTTKSQVKAPNSEASRAAQRQKKRRHRDTKQQRQQRQQIKSLEAALDKLCFGSNEDTGTVKPTASKPKGSSTTAIGISRDMDMDNLTELAPLLL